MALPTASEERYYEQLRQTRRNRYRRENAYLTAFPEIVFIGDSLTELFPVERLLSSQMLMANRGISASRTDHILDHIDCHLPGAVLHKAFLMIGVNDLGYGISPDVTIANVKAIIEAILDQFPFINLYLMEILPVNEQTTFAKTVGLRTNQAIRHLNEAYHNLSNAYVNTALVPTYSFFLDDQGQLAEDLTSDGLHLSAKGYDRLAGIVKAYLD